MKQLTLFILLMITGSTILFAQSYSGGSGTSGDPYQIATTDDLITLSKTVSHWGKDFIQTADISFDSDETLVDWDGDGSATWDTEDQKGLATIGDWNSGHSNPPDDFEGNYDGGDYTISNLYINRPGQDYVGLFGMADQDYPIYATIENLIVEDANVTGSDCVGAIAGRMTGDEMINCHVYGGTVSGNSIVGGLTGYCNNSNTIFSKCSSSAVVSATADDAGGLIGSSVVPPTESYSTGNVSGTRDIGGLLGSIYTYSSESDVLENCYSTGDVTRASGSSYASIGAFVGQVQIGSEMFGGTGELTIQYCYSTGSVYYSGASNPTDKGFVGEVYEDPFNGRGVPTYVSNYFDSQASNQSTATGATAKTTTQMQTQSTFTSWDFSSTWSIDGTAVTNAGYPYLQNNLPQAAVSWDGSASSDWNTASNWTGDAVPASGDNVVITTDGTAPVIASGTGASCAALTVNSGATLTINSGGSLITKGSITNNGTINIKRSIPDGEWHLVSLPISGATANIFLGDYLRSWDESEGQWVEITDENTALSPAQGYLLWGVTKATTYTFTGTSLTGEQTISLTTGGSGEQQGINLVGNPYPSSIDWSVLDDTYGAVYYYDAANGHYDTWNSGSGTNGGQQYLPPGQGFFVYTDGTETSFTVDNTARVHDNATSFYKSAPKGEANELRILASDAEGRTDETLMIFDASAQAGFEPNTDAWKMFSGAEGLGEIYCLTNEKALAIDRRPLENIIQLGFTAQSKGNYSIGLNGQTTLPEVEMEDTKEGVFHNLKENAYTFDWQQGDAETRFKLHLSTVGMEEQESAEPFRVYVANQQLYIQSELQGEIQVRVLDITGRLLMHRQISGSGTISIPTSLKTGIYMVEVIQKQKRTTQKVVISE